MQKETKIQGILMCLFYLGHLCLDLVCTALVNNFMLTDQLFEVPTDMAWKLASKWAILKVDEGLDIWEKCIYVQ